MRQLTSPYKVLPEEWDSSGQHTLAESVSDPGRSAYLREADRVLGAQVSCLLRAVQRLESGGAYSCEDIAQSWLPYGDDLCGYVRELSRELFRSGRERTARAYRSSAGMLQRFTGGGRLAVSHLNACLLESFESWLLSRGLSLNTVSFYMRNLRAVYNRAVAGGIIAGSGVSPFGKVFTGSLTTRKRALGVPELGRLKALGPSLAAGGSPTHGLYTAWRYFFFCFYARGMSFVDMAYLRKDQVHGGQLSYRRHKTGGLLTVRLSGPLPELLASFVPETADSPYLFPVLAGAGGDRRRQYESGLRLQNLRLKALGRLAGTGCALTTHVTRHSWASLAKHEQVPLWVISEGLGHRDEKTTYTYLASFEQDVLEQAARKVTAALERAKKNERSGPPAGPG
jgi:integrase